MQIGKEKVVSIDYTLTDPQGTVLDTSQGREPLTYMQGAGNIIPGLERELEGKSKGDKVNVTVPPDQAYGERSDQLVQQVPRASFQGIDKVEPGMRFRAQGPQGHAMIVTVTDIQGDNVTIDANHPLAGVPLTFDVDVVDIREATDDEKAHGHAHGAGGHQH